MADTKVFCDCGKGEYWCINSCPMPEQPPSPAAHDYGGRGGRGCGEQGGRHFYDTGQATPSPSAGTAKEGE